MRRTLKVRVGSKNVVRPLLGRIMRGVDTRPDAGLDGRPPGALRAFGDSALVDISNHYVMFEYGRPRIFDLDKIHGGLTVRWAGAGEKLELLNGNTIGWTARSA